MQNDFLFALIPLVAIIVGSAMITGLVWLGFRARTRRVELMTDLQNRVLDKFGSAGEFIEFVRTPEGRQWMTTSTESKSRQADKILSSLRWGLILGSFGGAFLILATIEERDLVYPGFLFGSVGVGFLMHAFLATKIARRWGLMPSVNEDEQEG